MSECEATRYGRVRDCDGPAKFVVRYGTSGGKIVSEHPACFRHGLAEVDRHHESAGMATCELVDGK